MRVAFNDAFRMFVACYVPTFHAVNFMSRLTDSVNRLLQFEILLLFLESLEQRP